MWNCYNIYKILSKTTFPTFLSVDESSDKTPKIGSNYQAEIPSFVADVKPSERPGSILDVSIPIWQPETANSLSELEFNQYLVVASSCAVGKSAITYFMTVNVSV